MTLPPLPECTLYRGISRKLPKELQTGQEIVWYGVTSTSSSIAIMNSFLKVKEDGDKTAFIVTTEQARDIMRYSAYASDEREYVLPMQTSLIVTNVDDIEKERMTEVHLRDNPALRPVPVVHTKDTERRMRLARKAEEERIRKEALRKIFIAEEDFSIDESRILGEGGFGRVFRGMWGAQAIAVKTLRAALSDETQRSIEDEAILMMELRNPNIVQFYGLGTKSYAILMEHMPRGSLYDLLHSTEVITESTLYQIACDVTNGLKYLHTCRILHRDLKSPNVLLDSNLRAKLTDFGLAKVKAEQTRTMTRRGTVGTYAWMAPELLEEPPPYSPASDVYALGMIFWELVTRKTPFARVQNDAAMIAKLLRKECEVIPATAPMIFKRVIRQCWMNTEQRPTAAALLEQLTKACQAEEESPDRQGRLSTLPPTSGTQGGVSREKLSSAGALPRIGSALARTEEARRQAAERAEAEAVRAQRAEAELAALRAQVAKEAERALKAEADIQAAKEKQAREVVDAKRQEELRQQAARDKAAQERPLIPTSEITAFLKLVAEGEQDQAQVQLERKRELVLASGTVTDLSGRTFNNITALQYAVWALDWQMWTMLLKHIDPATAREQIAAMATGSWVREHGEHAGALIQNLMAAIKTMLDNWDPWTYEQINQHWCTVVGSAQRALPAHVVNEYCHTRQPFEPCPNFQEPGRYQPGWRSRTTDEKEWFTAKYNGGLLGEKFAVLRFNFAQAEAMTLKGWAGGRDRRGSGADRRALEHLLEARLQQHAQLKDALKPTAAPRLHA